MISDQANVAPRSRVPSRPVSVVIPTVGRVAMLERCLASIARARPLPDELLVVDQSQDPRIAVAVAQSGVSGARHVSCDDHGVSSGVNRGLLEAGHDTVLITHDDCTVAVDWVGAAWRHMQEDPARLVSGRVLPARDAHRTPSIRMDDQPHDYSGRLVYDALSAANMALDRKAVLDLGGFDPRLYAAEDSDLCYRWLRTGRRIAYRPDVVVVHHDWRSPEELERLYVAYWRGGGWFYGKHLRRGDPRVLPLLADDIRAAARGHVAGVLRGTPRWADPRRGFLRGLPQGLIGGLVAPPSIRGGR